MRSMGLNPEELLVKKAQAEPHRIIISGGQDEIEFLRNELKEALKKELLTDP